MGITKTDCTLLFHAKKNGVDFNHSLMLGRLHLYTSKEEIASCIRKFGNSAKDIADVKFSDEYSEPLFEILGATKVDSIDFSNYEKATIIHDLNNPIPENFKNTFSCIIDGGTIEHVFNFPVAIKNCMDALKVGGHYIGITPVNNQMGHGFYQFSPELFYRIFSEENGFRVKNMLICSDVLNEPVWYEVADPAKVKSRVMIVNNMPLTLRFIAEKISQKDVFATTPQQSDYTNTWNTFTSLSENIIEPSESKLKFFYRKLVPLRIKIIMRNLYNIYKKDQMETTDIGTVNPEHFKKVEL